MNKQARPQDLYLVSSTLHFFWAWLLASKHETERDAHLWLIDQYTQKPMVFVPFLNQGTPFKSWGLFDGRELTGFAKLKLRKTRFKEVANWLQNNKIDRVFIGNDRSVLGQFIIKTTKEQAKKMGRFVPACFLDDGVFSYLGRPASKAWSERYFDSFFKKMIFGFWYDSPDTLGASRWVDEAWVMYPQQINAALKAKTTHPLGLTEDDLLGIRTLAKNIVKKHDVLLADKLIELDKFIALPNHRIFNQSSGFEEDIKGFIKQQKKLGYKIGVKYHPAAGKKDILCLTGEGCEIIPSLLSFEVILIMLDKAEFVGDLSTTTLLAHYFGKSSCLISVVKGDAANEMLALCTALNIKAC